jgi:transcription elongation factor GreA
MLLSCFLQLSAVKTLLQTIKYASAIAFFNKKVLFLQFNNHYNASATLRRCYFFCITEKKGGIMSVQYVTKETLEKMQAELQHMRGVERPAASKAIAEAREKGDLKENAEYDAAKEAQGMLEAKIKQLEGIIANARIIDEATIDTSKVTILTRVTVTNLATKKQITYQIVGEHEADLKAGKISVTSPIGNGLLGKAVGETAEVQVPAGVVKFKVEEITI